MSEFAAQSQGEHIVPQHPHVKCAVRTCDSSPNMASSLRFSCFCCTSSLLESLMLMASTRKWA